MYCCGLSGSIQEFAGVAMTPTYDLILECDGSLRTETLQSVDADEAWRLGRERYPNSIRAVVVRDDLEAELKEPR